MKEEFSRNVMVMVLLFNPDQNNSYSTSSKELNMLVTALGSVKTIIDYIESRHAGSQSEPNSDRKFHFSSLSVCTASKRLL